MISSDEDLKFNTFTCNVLSRSLQVNTFFFSIKELQNINSNLHKNIKMYIFLNIHFGVFVFI